MGGSYQQTWRFYKSKMRWNSNHDQLCFSLALFSSILFLRGKTQMSEHDHLVSIDITVCVKEKKHCTMHIPILLLLGCSSTHARSNAIIPVFRNESWYEAKELCLYIVTVPLSWTRFARYIDKYRWHSICHKSNQPNSNSHQNHMNHIRMVSDLLQP